MKGFADSMYNQDLTVDLRLAMGGMVKACNVNYFTIYAPEDKEHLTQIQIPKEIFSSVSVTMSFFL